MGRIRLSRRPKKWDDPEAMAVSLEKYFSDLDGGRRPTIGGMARHLGFCSTKTFWQYSRDPKFKDVISAGKLVVEQWLEENLTSKTMTGGCIFALCNITRNRPDNEGRWVNQRDVTTMGDKLPPATMVMTHD